MSVRIPKKAKRVFHGTVFDVYQWPQKMYDGSTKTFEVAKRLDGVSVIATVGNKIVTLYQTQPTRGWYYTLPGGFIDEPGETPRQAALRELLEETGLKPGQIQLWRKFERSASRFIADWTMFIARDCKKAAEQNLDGGEKVRLVYDSFEQFLNRFDDPEFHAAELILEMRDIRADKRKREALRKLIFG